MLALLLSACVAAAAAQGVVSNGNSQLPQCAYSCPSLQQASQACGGTNAASQQIWNCFCQSAYLRTLYQSAQGVCDSTCTSADDLQQVSSWYRSNCGSDDGVSEHAESASSTSAGATTSGAASASASAASSPSSSSSSSSSSYSASSSGGGDWWSQHYRWIIMLIVLAVCLPALGVLGAWLKRRHERSQDRIREGFNAGITSRSAGGDDAFPPPSFPSADPDDSGRDSPARTRDAFMPYGYQYSRSVSRAGSRRAPTPGAPGPPPEEMEKAMGAHDDVDVPPGHKGKGVLIREHSAAADSVETEK